MLVLLTGNRQVGKTRLLEALLEKAKEENVSCVGVITPGIWEHDANGKNIKLGIDAILLPQHEKIPFAIKRDGGEGDASSRQSDSANLGWKIFDDSICDINKHFDDLMQAGINQDELLVIDELGTLELVHEKGLTSALAVLDNPCEALADSKTNAVAVVRPELIDVAKKRFAPVWGEPLVIDASDKGAYLGMESLIRSLSSASDKS